MSASLDSTICRRCGEPMAAVISSGTLPRYLCRLCGDLDLAPPLATVRPTPSGYRPQFLRRLGEQVKLSLDVVVCSGTWADTGRQPIHQPATRYPDQLPLHRTQLPQRHCA